jgi:hypothetical protein
MHRVSAGGLKARPPQRNVEHAIRNRYGTSTSPSPLERGQGVCHLNGLPEIMANFPVTYHENPAPVINPEHRTEGGHTQCRNLPNTVGKDSDIVGKSPNTVGKDSDIVGKSLNTVGKDSDIGRNLPNTVGKDSDIVGKSLNTVGKKNT